MDEQQKKMIGDGEGESPLTIPLQKDVTMRTMQSDIDSMLKSGGGMPQPYVPVVNTPPPAVKPVAPFTPQAMPSSTSQPSQPSSSSPVFQAPSAMPSISSTSTPQSVPQFGEEKKSMRWGWIVWVIVILGLAAVGYYFIYPYFTTPKDVIPTPQLSPTPTPSPLTNTPEVPFATTTPSSTPDISSIPAPIIHTSFFKTKADVTSEVTLSSYDLVSLKTAFGSAPVTIPLFKEFIIKNDTQSLIAKDFLDLVMPSLGEPLIANIESDFTMFTYADKNGVWPGVIFKMKTEVDKTTFESNVKNLLETADKTIFTNFYSVAPGTPGALWKQGKTGTLLNRYLLFVAPSHTTSFNYAFVNDYFIMSASYDGFKETLKRI